MRRFLGHVGDVAESWMMTTTMMMTTTIEQRGAAPSGESYSKRRRGLPELLADTARAE
jgi:hypothetical protein